MSSLCRRCECRRNLYLSFIESGERCQLTGVRCSPSEFVYVPMKAGFARNIIDQMNQNGATKFAPSAIGPTGREEDERVQAIYHDTLRDHWETYWRLPPRDHHDQRVLDVVASRKSPTMGYVTRDECPGPGDDIEHIPGEYASCV